MTHAPTDPATLRNLPLFSCLSEAQLASVTPAVTHRTFAPRACILRAGDIPDGLYIVVSGRARIVHEDGDGHALIAGDVGPNEFFGEMGLINPAACPASVHALSPCEVVHVPRKILLECIQDSAAAAVYMLRAVVDRLCAAHGKLAELALMTVYERVARVLVENGREADGGWHVRVGSEEIAALVGASREMVSRVVKKMIAEGLARRYKRRLIVLDRAALARPAAARQPASAVAG